MRSLPFQNKIHTLPGLLERTQAWRQSGKSIVFTNGCFDILHPGHLASLQQASAEGDVLIVGVNSDASVKKLKGPHRPVNNEASRATVLAALEMVDAVVLFNEDTPENLIRQIVPQVLVKGGDYTESEIAGAAFVKSNGGRVVINPLVPGISTSAIIERINQPL